MKITIPYLASAPYGYADDQSKVESAKASKYAYIAAIAAVVFIIVLIILFAKKKNNG